MYDTPTATLSINYWAEPASIKVWQDVTPEQIINAACIAFHLDKKELISACRKNELVRPRYICYYIIKLKTELTLKGIGSLFNRDHTSIIHGLRCIENELSVPAYRQQMNIDLKMVMELI